LQSLISSRSPTRHAPIVPVDGPPVGETAALLVFVSQCHRPCRRFRRAPDDEEKRMKNRKKENAKIASQ
jgi:hypothetical protein